MTDFDSLIQVAGDTAAGKTPTDGFINYLTQWLTQVNDNELDLLVGAILVLAQPEPVPTLYSDIRRLLKRAFIPESTIQCVLVLVVAGEIERDRETKTVSVTAAEAEAQFAPHGAVKVRARRAPVGECPACDSYRNAGIKHHPSHEASPRCESGAKPHCTCDVCF